MAEINRPVWRKVRAGASASRDRVLATSRRRVRKLSIIFLVLVCLAASLMGTAYLFRTPIVNYFLRATLARLKLESGFSVTYRKIYVTTALGAELHDLTVSDPKGTYVSIPRVRVRFSILDLLKNRIWLNKLAIYRPAIDFRRLAAMKIEPQKDVGEPTTIVVVIRWLRLVDGKLYGLPKLMGIRGAAFEKVNLDAGAVLVIRPKRLRFRAEIRKLTLKLIPGPLVLKSFRFLGSYDRGHFKIEKLKIRTERSEVSLETDVYSSGTGRFFVDLNIPRIDPAEVALVWPRLAKKLMPAPLMVRFKTKGSWRSLPFTFVAAQSRTRLEVTGRLAAPSRDRLDELTYSLKIRGGRVPTKAIFRFLVHRRYWNAFYVPLRTNIVMKVQGRGLDPITMKAHGRLVTQPHLISFQGRVEKGNFHVKRLTAFVGWGHFFLRGRIYDMKRLRLFLSGNVYRVPRLPELRRHWLLRRILGMKTPVVLKIAGPIRGTVARPRIGVKVVGSRLHRRGGLGRAVGGTLRIIGNALWPF